MASGAKADEAFFPQAHPASAATDRHQRARLLAQDTIRRANASQLAATIDEVTIDRIFNRSVSLSSDAIVDFVTQLCKVSEQVRLRLRISVHVWWLLLFPARVLILSLSLLPMVKPSGTHACISHGCLPQELYVGLPALQPRVFSMQKIVEVADFNMDARPRVVWAKVWDALSKFFARVGCHPNHSIAMYAIDSLKQLSLKFLEKVR
jgi:brefeldin A-inhibited guanine nucleotide-exchange protein